MTITIEGEDLPVLAAVHAGERDQCQVPPFSIEPLEAEQHHQLGRA